MNRVGKSLMYLALAGSIFYNANSATLPKRVMRTGTNSENVSKPLSVEMPEIDLSASSINKYPVSVKSLPKEPSGFIMLDPGHDSANIGFHINEYKEEDINLQIAYKMRERLVSLDYVVFMTRTDDHGLNINNLDFDGDNIIDKKDEILCRAKYIREAPVDLILSIHVDALLNKKKKPVTHVDGMRVHFYGIRSKKQAGNGLLDHNHPNDVRHYSKESLLLADKINKEFQNSGLESTFFGSDMKLLSENPSLTQVYLELGFMTNKDNLNYITSKSGQYEIADAIAEVLADKDFVLKISSNPYKVNENKTAHLIK